MNETSKSADTRPVQIGTDIPITARFYEGISAKTGRPYTYLGFFMEGLEIGREFPDAFKRSWIEEKLRG